MRLEQRELTVLHPLLGDGQQRTHEAVQLVLGTVVGVKCHVDGVVFRDLLGESSEGGRARDLVLDRGTGEVLGSPRGDLNDAVGTGLGEALQGGIQRLGGADVDGRVGEPAFLGSVDHLGVDLRSCNWHDASFRTETRNGPSLSRNSLLGEPRQSNAQSNRSMSEASTPILPMDLALAAESIAPGMVSRKLIGMLATS